jgi:anti-sigma-K factor RskA
MSNSIERDMGEVKANVAELLRLVQADAESRKEIYKRLNSLERWRSGIVAAGSTVTVIFSLIVGLLKVKLGGGR